MQRRGAERRRFVRVADEVIVSVTTTGTAVDSDGVTLNFSAGGVLLVLDSVVPPGTYLDVVLRLTASRTLQFGARVRRVRTLSDHHHEVACEFTAGTVADHRALQDLISDRLGASPTADPQPA